MIHVRPKASVAQPEQHCGGFADRVRQRSTQLRRDHEQCAWLLQSLLVDDLRRIVEKGAVIVETGATMTEEFEAGIVTPRQRRSRRSVGRTPVKRVTVQSNRRL